MILHEQTDADLAHRTQKNPSNSQDPEAAIVKFLEDAHRRDSKRAPSKRMTFGHWLRLNIGYDGYGQPHLLPTGSATDAEFQVLAGWLADWRDDDDEDEPLDLGKLLRAHGYRITLTKDYGPVLAMFTQAA